MQSNNNYPDLSKKLDNQSDYPDLTSPIKSQKVDTFLGQMNSPNIRQEITNPKLIDEMIRTAGAIPSAGLFGGNIGSIFGKGLLDKASSVSPFLGNVLKKAEMPLMGGVMGAATNPDNPLTGGVIGASMGTVPLAFQAAKGAKNIAKNALNDISHQEIGKVYQSGHDILKKSAEDIFQDVGKKVIDRNIKPIPVDQKIIDEISTHFPKTDAAYKLLSDARKGDYQSLRDLQTELFERGTKATKNNLPSESNKGEEILDLRNKINKSIFDHLNKEGHPDLASSLRDAMSKYRNLQETYYARKLSPYLKNMVHEESREIPENIGKLMSSGSVPADRIMKHNPSVFDLVSQYEKNRNALKKLKYIAGSTAALGVLGGLASIPGTVQNVKGIFK